MKLMVDNGFRAIAHDRRGGGRSGQPWDGNNLDTYADDLAAVIESEDLHDVIWSGTPPAAAKAPPTSAGTARHGCQAGPARRDPAADAEDGSQP